AGIGYSNVSREPDQTLGQDAVEACQQAISDAGLSPNDIDGICTADVQPYANAGHQDGIDFVSPSYIIPALSLTDIRWSHRDQGFLASSFSSASESVAAGQCTNVLLWRAMSFPHGQRYGQVDPVKAGGVAQFLLPYGNTGTGPPNHAYTYRRYMDRYGASRKHMASFICNNRENALFNEKGYWFNYRPEHLAVEEYMNGRMVADPFCIHDCDVPVQGCAAYVITTRERAKYAPNNAAYVVGFSKFTDGISEASRSSSLGPLETLQKISRGIGDSLWEETGLKPRDISTANLYDGFSYFVYLWLEGLGFCNEGEAFDYVQDGRVSISGELPLNTSGGNLGEGRMHGAPHITEAALQVMGRAGTRQIKDSALSLYAIGMNQSGIGRAAILSREPL
ncbi:thiolase family protein, partial [Dehalococcoidia bacterium]|nr:thiolase family protein [Dehalococcoidia bacterium]